MAPLWGMGGKRGKEMECEGRKVREGKGRSREV